VFIGWDAALLRGAPPKPSRGIGFIAAKFGQGFRLKSIYYSESKYNKKITIKIIFDNFF